VSDNAAAMTMFHLLFQSSQFPSALCYAIPRKTPSLVEKLEQDAGKTSRYNLYQAKRKITFAYCAVLDWSKI
jgi:hypothetical protein